MTTDARRSVLFNTRCRKTGYDVRQVTTINLDKSADRCVYVHGHKVSSDELFTKVLLNLFMNFESKDSNLLHAVIT